MSTQAPGISMGKMAQVYATINGKVNELNKQVTINNIKTVAKTNLVYMAIFAAGLVIAVASAMLLGVTFPAAISWQVLTGATIGFSSSMVFLQTFGKNMFIKMRRKQTELSKEMRKEFMQVLTANYHSGIPKAIYKYVHYNPRSNVLSIPAAFTREAFGLGIKKLKLDSKEIVEKRFIENHEQRQKKIEEKKKRDLEKASKKEESGFYSFLPAFMKPRISEKV